MRMWMVNPKWLCRKHLLGEHGEIHKHRHSFVKHHSIAKRVSPVVQVEPLSMQARHDALASEMSRRGYTHASPYEQPEPLEHMSATVDTQAAMLDLFARCPECRERYSKNS